ncbi:glycosyltransferase family 4 protein [Butyrivibrio sp. INlla16]|uniref:glycosyltransferase family 4 protein n=1 Tax=Butyrivibrio sp. INlla16 TaxID=1520807 RepID=UPI000883102D|nr:glycosyltransferase family 4 protein [Butyrivibrio sp. INlla16]SDB22935.1 Glycosyltransferase involved in cell wall bisynthesis [Butyrivibrio sp. INlla16]
MKIAMIGHKRIPSREGGVEIVVEELSTRLVLMGHAVTAYNRKGKNVADKNADKEAHKLKNYKGIRIVHVPTPDLKALNAVVYSFLATIFALLGNYDVIHYHAEGPCAMLVIPHFFGIRTIATIHGLDWQRAKWGGFATKYLKFGEKIAARNADEVIVLSRNVQQYFLDTYGRQTIYIPNGVNRTEFLEPDRIVKKFGLEKEKYILYLGRIVPEKGITYLLEAFSKIDTDMKLVIAGGGSHSGDFMQEVMDMAKKDSRVVMTGFVQGNTLTELFSNCYMYVLPSDIEGMPISLLEAMSFGRRCLASDIPENTEACREYAKYFKKSDVEDLKKKLEESIANPGSFHKFDEIMDYCYERFDWNKVTGASVRLYIDAILNVERINNI